LAVVSVKQRGHVALSPRDARTTLEGSGRVRGQMTPIEPEKTGIHNASIRHAQDIPDRRTVYGHQRAV